MSVKRQGMIAKAFGISEPKFPWILGSEGAGKIVAVGEKVIRFRVGDPVYGHICAKNPKVGFYAEYTAVDATNVWPIPSTITTGKAGALLIDGAAALRGLDDTLGLKKDEKLMLFGASGGVGHFANPTCEAIRRSGICDSFRGRRCSSGSRVGSGCCR